MNKIVALQQALRDTPPDAAGWLWWLDVDTLIVDVAAPLPLQRWAGRDVVLWGQRELVEGGDIQGGFASLPGAPKAFLLLQPAGGHSSCADRIVARSWAPCKAIFVLGWQDANRAVGVQFGRNTRLHTTLPHSPCSLLARLGGEGSNSTLIFMSNRHFDYG